MYKTLLVLTLLFFVSCSAPKHTYYFDYHTQHRPASPPSQEKPVFVARASPVIEPSPANETVAEPETGVTKDHQQNLSARKTAAVERKRLKDELRVVKKEVRAKMKDVKNARAQNSELDYDLRMAIIFGAVGLVLSLFAGISAAFWVLGVVAIVVGVVFLIRWLMRQ